MATPWPKPVEPNCSRSVTVARIAAGSTLSRWPARFASCWSSERLLPPERRVLIASKSRKSPSCITVVPGARPPRLWPGGLEMGLAVVRLNPADIAVVAAVDHVEFAGPRIFEHQRAGVPEVHQHHRVGHARFGDVDAGLGDDRGKRRAVVAGFLHARENRVTGIFDIRLRLIDLMLLEPVGVAAKLLLDPVGGAVERHLRLTRAVRCLEDDALDYRRDDVAG